LLLEGPLEVFDFGVGVLLGFGEVVDLLFIVKCHLAVVSLLSLEFRL
jgi:hypothetical protein